jgi:hypothetical protein
MNLKSFNFIVIIACQMEFILNSCQTLFSQSSTLNFNKLKVVKTSDGVVLEGFIIYEDDASIKLLNFEKDTILLKKVSFANSSNRKLYFKDYYKKSGEKMGGYLLKKDKYRLFLLSNDGKPFMLNSEELITEKASTVDGLSIMTFLGTEYHGDIINNDYNTITFVDIWGDTLNLPLFLIKRLEQIKEEYIGYGGCFGTPAGINGALCWNRGSFSIRGSGGYWGIINGIQLNLQYMLSMTKTFCHHLSIQLYYNEYIKSISEEGSDFNTRRAIGLDYSINYNGFFVSIGFNYSPYPFKDPAFMLQLGFLMEDKLKVLKY